jgi:hypothetical protein
MIDPRFKQWVNGADTVILLCWDLGHVWNQSIYADIKTGPHGEHLLTGNCERGCGVRRTRYMSSTWSPESNRNTYDYPKGYSPRGLYREDGFFMDAEHRAFIRREIARRTQEEIAEAKQAARLAKQRAKALTTETIDLPEPDPASALAAPALTFQAPKAR